VFAITSQLFNIKRKMREENKKQLKQWADFNNGHPYDDERLYEIVINTIDDVASESDFKEVMAEGDADKYFKLYEQLICFAIYLRKNGKLNC
jgi:hypothetical protein